MGPEMGPETGPKVDPKMGPKMGRGEKKCQVSVARRTGNSHLTKLRGIVGGEKLR